MNVLSAFNVLAWVMIAIETVILCLLIRRLGGARVLSGAAHRSPAGLSLTRISSLDMNAWTIDGARFRLPGTASGLVIFVRARCLASYRAATLIADQAGLDAPGFPVIVAVADNARDAQRFAAAVARCVELVRVRPARLPKELRASIPCAVTLGPGRRVRHADSIGTPAQFAKFTEACGDAQVRSWLTRALGSSAQFGPNLGSVVVAELIEEGEGIAPGAPGGSQVADPVPGIA